MTTLRSAVSLFALVLAAVTAVNGQSVVDTARRERQRQNTNASKTVLNPDSRQPATTPRTPAPEKASAPAATSAATPAAGAEAAAPASKPAAATAITDNKGRDEKYWRSTFEKARTDLKRSEDKLKVTDLKMDDLKARLLRESIYSRETAIRAEFDKAQQEQSGLRKEVADGRQRLRDLEEELRRSGGLPGWAR
jgi:hypothetical protein